MCTHARACRHRARWQPERGADKRLKALAGVLERTVETGASAANIGYAVKDRYKDIFGGKPLEDVEMLEAADDVAASEQITLLHKSCSISVLGADSHRQR